MELSVDLLLSIAVGLFVAFYGYRFFRTSITLIGAVIGYFLGKLIFGTFAGAMGLAENPTAELITIVLFIIAFGGLAFFFYLKAIILICTVVIGFKFLTGYTFTVVENPILNKFLITVIGGIIGLVFGLAVYYIQKWAIMFATSYIGAQIIASAVTPAIVVFDPVRLGADKLRSIIFPGSFITASVVISGLLLIIFTISGFTFQLKNKK